MWKDIKDHVGYQVSASGKIRSKDRRVKTKNRYGTWSTRPVAGRLLQYEKKICGAGYHTAALGRRTTVLVHRIVAIAFVKGRTRTKNQVNHKNGNRLDNRARNLEWVSPKGNIRHALGRGSFVEAHKNAGLRWSGNKNPKAKLNQAKVTQIRRLYKNGLTQKEIGKKFCLHQATVSAIVRNEAWSNDWDKSRTM